ncbi:hypothetical protein AB1E18_007068 [Capra hircus]
MTFPDEVSTAGVEVTSPGEVGPAGVEVTSPAPGELVGKGAQDQPRQQDGTPQPGGEEQDRLGGAPGGEEQDGTPQPGGEEQDGLGGTPGGEEQDRLGGAPGGEEQDGTPQPGGEEQDRLGGAPGGEEQDGTPQPGGEEQDGTPQPGGEEQDGLGGTPGGEEQDRLGGAPGGEEQDGTPQPGGKEQDRLGGAPGGEEQDGLGGAPGGEEQDGTPQPGGEEQDGTPQPGGEEQDGTPQPGGEEQDGTPQPGGEEQDGLGGAPGGEEQDGLGGAPGGEEQDGLGGAPGGEEQDGLGGTPRGEEQDRLGGAPGGEEQDRVGGARGGEDHQEARSRMGRRGRPCPRTPGTEPSACGCISHDQASERLSDRLQHLASSRSFQTRAGCLDRTRTAMQDPDKQHRQKVGARREQPAREAAAPPPSSASASPHELGSESQGAGRGALEPCSWLIKIEHNEPPPGMADLVPYINTSICAKAWLQDSPSGRLCLPGRMRRPRSPSELKATPRPGDSRGPTGHALSSTQGQDGSVLPRAKLSPRRPQARHQPPGTRGLPQAPKARHVPSRVGSSAKTQDSEPAKRPGLLSALTPSSLSGSWPAVTGRRLVSSCLGPCELLLTACPRGKRLPPETVRATDEDASLCSRARSPPELGFLPGAFPAPALHSGVTWVSGDRRVAQLTGAPPAGRAKGPVSSDVANTDAWRKRLSLQPHASWVLRTYHPPGTFRAATSRSRELAHLLLTPR